MHLQTDALGVALQARIMNREDISGLAQRMRLHHRERFLPKVSTDLSVFFLKILLIAGSESSVGSEGIVILNPT